jgi:hypothetical protein
MENIQIFKWLAIISPIISGIIGGFLTHILANRSKRLEMLYQHKIPAFKEMQKEIINFKRQVSQNLIEQKGSDLAPEQSEEIYST